MIKKVLLGIVAVFFWFGIIGSCIHDGNYSSETSQSVQQKEKQKNLIVSIVTMMNDLKRNAMVVSDTYKNKDLKIVDCIVSDIESSGEYISVKSPTDEYSLANILCYPVNRNVKKQFKRIQVGQMVTIYGQITDVGEILGYAMDLEKIE